MSSTIWLIWSELVLPWHSPSWETQLFLALSLQAHTFFRNHQWKVSQWYWQNSGEQDADFDSLSVSLVFLNELVKCMTESSNLSADDTEFLAFKSAVHGVAVTPSS